jgi:YD repeat-containing protein
MNTTTGTEGSDKYGDTGNICSKTETRLGGSPETTTYTYDDYNKLTGITYQDSTTETLTYDDNGQLIERLKSTGEKTEYIWNERGNLTKVILPTGEPVEYTYDGTGKLTGRKDAERNDTYTQTGWDIVCEKDKNGVKTYYTGLSAYKEDGTIIDGKQEIYYHYDHLGNTRLITDSNGNLLEKYNYEAYGRVLDAGNSPIDPIYLKDVHNLFVGGHGIRYDAKTDLNYMRFRWFGNDILRFISPDVIK